MDENNSPQENGSSFDISVTQLSRMLQRFVDGVNGMQECMDVLHDWDLVAESDDEYRALHTMLRSIVNLANDVGLCLVNIEKLSSDRPD